MLELYHWEPNTFSLKPLITLNEKGLEFTSRYVDFLAFEHCDLADLNAMMEVQHNPEGEGPILVDRGTAMTESFFITLYLDEAFPEVPLRPTDPEGHWRVLMWARFCNEVLEPAVSTLGAHKYLAPALKTRDRKAADAALKTMPTLEQQQGWTMALNDAYPDELIEDSRRKLALGVKKVEETLETGDWLAGSAYSLADIDLFALLHPAEGLAPDIVNANAAPRTMAWLAQIRERPAVKAALATSKTGRPEQCFTPGPEHSRWG